METPRRRGRPPGSKNLVKPSTTWPNAVPALTDPLTPIPERVTPYNPPATIESWTDGQQGRIQVSITFGATMSKAGVEKTGFFPVGWPIPQLNDVVRLGGEIGRVKWVEYDYDLAIVRISAQ